MEDSSSAGATLAPTQFTRRAPSGATLGPAQVTRLAPEARESQWQVAFLLLGGVLLLYDAVGFGLYQFFTFVF